LPNAVLDSFAVLAFLFGEPGHEKVLTLLEEAADTDSNLLIAGPNWAEIRYIVERKVGLAQWREVRARLLGLPIEIVPADQELSELAGELKVTKKMSLADCFAAALAKREKAAVYTGDPEFEAVEREIKIVWL
jgi:predicted nucleic acid-binding protein